MASKALPAQDVLHQLLSYNPETGELFWKERGVEWFPAVTPARSLSLCALWNARYAGKEAFTCVSDGYRTGSISGSNYKAHRVIWKMMTNEEPVEIDHEFGDRADNRWEKLRDVSQSENLRNRKIPENNKSGVIGVHFWDHGGVQYWVALCGKKYRYFHQFHEAVAARKAAELEYGFHENHGRAA